MTGVLGGFSVPKWVWIPKGWPGRLHRYYLTEYQLKYHHLKSFLTHETIGLNRGDLNKTSTPLPTPPRSNWSTKFLWPDTLFWEKKPITGDASSNGWYFCIGSTPSIMSRISAMSYSFLSVLLLTLTIVTLWLDILWVSCKDFGCTFCAISYVFMLANFVAFSGDLAWNRNPYAMTASF